MGKIDLKTFADSCGVSVLELGHVFGSMGLSLNFKDKSFEGEALWERLKKLDTNPKIKMPTPNSKETCTDKIIKYNKRSVCVELRRKALDLFTVNNFNAGWIPLVGNRLFTALRITSTIGKFIDVGIGAATTGNNSFNFTVSAPFYPWYCLILKSTNQVHLRRKDDFLSIKYWDTKKSAACLNTNTNQTNFLFLNQVEVFREELESL